MKNIPLMLAAGMMVFASCSSTKQPANTGNEQLTAKLSIKPVIQPSDSLMLRFTVYNPSNKAQSFCKWHTPFEPPMSKYLDIIDEQGLEAQYQGAMAKRVMPPPPSSYQEVKAGDSLVVSVDIRKSYKIDHPGKYTVKYNAKEISGLAVKDSVSFIYQP